MKIILLVMLFKRKEHWALLSLGVNLAQTGLKFFGGVFTGSLSLMGEAIHSLSDSLASIIAYFSIKFSEKKSEKFPYGLYKLENLGSLAIGIFLLISAYEIFHKAISEDIKLKTESLPIGLGIVIFSLISSLTLSFLERKAGRELNSPTLIADSYHTLTDALGALIVLTSFVFAYFGYNYDKYFAIGVAMIIVYTAIGLLKEQVSTILDASADEETVNRIREIILSFDEVEKIKRLLVRNAGGKLFIDAEILLKPSNFIRSHKIADEIERRIIKALGNVEMVFIHYEPSSENELKVAVLSEDGISVGKNFRAKKVYVFESRKGKPKVIELNGVSEEELAKVLAGENVDMVICGHHPKSSKAKWILHRNGIFVWETEKENIYEALAEVSSLREGKDLLS